ncbi:MULTISPECIES: transposase family protein [unclassified Moorena]|uniref:transposase family protein n=2 Tax=Coleofasciculaceae TaxID=1892251 RepID=UPI0013CB57C9|nr:MULTISPECIES: transposase family protein [unclassified Moorena]NES43440.1 transposase family protein [Moorena sp. SIO2C4]
MGQPPQSAPAVLLPSLSQEESTPEPIEILEAFSDIPDVRKVSGKRHKVALCLALFTLAIAAGNRGLRAIGDWLNSYREDKIERFLPPKRRIPSYSTIRRVLKTKGLSAVFCGPGSVLWH